MAPDFRLPADGQIRPEELPRLLAEWPAHDLVLTHRVARADSLLRRLVSAAYHLTLRVGLGIPYHDVDSSILISRRLWRRIARWASSDSAFIHAEVAIYAHQLGVSIKEVPIKHYPRTAGVARGLNLRDATRVPLRLARLWWTLRRRRVGIETR